MGNSNVENGIMMINMGCAASMETGELLEYTNCGKYIDSYI